MSIGGGAFMTMLMTLYNRPLLQAVSTSSGAGPLIAIPGALGFIWAGWGVPELPPGSVGYVSLLVRRSSSRRVCSPPRSGYGWRMACHGATWSSLLRYS
jgi:hypothetical protein